MTLQSRLFAIIIAIVLLPLLLVGSLVRGIIGRELERRAFGEVRQGAGTASAVFEIQLRNARDRSDLIANDQEFQRLLLDHKYAEVQSLLDRRLGELTDLIDFIVVSGSDAKPVAAALSKPEYLGGFLPPTAETIAAPGETTVRGVLTNPVPISSPDGRQKIASVYAGYYLDNNFAQSLAARSEVDATLLLNGTAIASTIPSAKHSSKPVTVRLPAKQNNLKTSIAKEAVFASPVPLRPDVPVAQFALLVTTSQAPVLNATQATTTSMIIVLFLAIAAAASLGYLLARSITSPIRELVAGANAIAAGRYDQHIRVRSRDEVGQLGKAFNEMAGRLSEHMEDLKESREKLGRALTRFGQILRSTHDMGQLLNEVVETSIDHLQARSGMVMLIDEGAHELGVSVARGLESTGLRLKVGEGLAGYVAHTGNPLRLPNGGSLVAPAEGEPKFRTAMLVPIFAQERVKGVLGLFDKEEGLDFSESDLANLLSLADQAGVAIENVLLHEQAERLSILDGLTSTWNHRYFRMHIRREIERSARFNKPFSLIMLDIDDFKLVNDRYGHLRGNSVLVDLVTRVKFMVREVDLLARYGGEEFVVILPETDESGGLLAAEKIRASVAERPFEGDSPLKITVSLGVACYPAHGQDEESLVRAADTAMYQAKGAGKNRVVLYSPENREAGRR